MVGGKALEEVRLQLQREGAQLKGRCGACPATAGISVQSVKHNVKTSVASTLNLAVR